MTLIAEGYTGVTGSPGVDKLVSLVRMIASGLDGTGRTINLAFDVPLLEDPKSEAPLFQDLRSLIVNVADPEDRLVDKLLVFLERPTTRSKKVLRIRVENSFKGEERIQVLRAIIPVVPPGANAPLEPQQADGSPVASATSAVNSYGQFQRRPRLLPGQFRRHRLLAGPGGGGDPARRLAGPGRRARRGALLRLVAAAGAEALPGPGARPGRRRLLAGLPEPGALLHPGPRHRGPGRRGAAALALQRAQPQPRAAG